MATLPARTVWRDFEVDGVVASGVHKPVKADIRQWGAMLEGTANSSTIVKQTLAALIAVTPAAETNGGMVLNDPSPVNNGIYYRSGGAWVKGRGFPDSFALLTVTGGTANALQVSLDAGVDPGEIVAALLVATSTNTGPATIAIAGGSPIALKSAAGTDLAAGELQAGKVTIIARIGSEWRVIVAFSRFAFRGAWSGAYDYVPDDLTQSGGSIWLALRANTNVSPAEGADWTLFLPGVSVADGSVTEAKLAAGVKNKIVAYVADRTALAALSATDYKAAHLDETHRAGLFHWNSSDLSARVTADPEQGVYVAPSSDATGASGAWVRQFDGALDVLWFGAVGDGTTDDQPAFAAAYALVKALGSAVTEGACGSFFGPPGRKYAFGATLNLDIPVNFTCASYILYTPTSGAAVVVGSAAPAVGRNTGYHIDIYGLRSVNGNTATPTGWNTAGTIGIELRAMQFSNVRVGRVMAFTYAGVRGNCTNNVFVKQHVQDNTIWIGDVAFCGIGVLAESVSGADGSFQVNEIHCQNIFANWANFIIGKSGDTNTNNNLFYINAMDAAAGGGEIWLEGAWYNEFVFGYANGSGSILSGSNYNRFYICAGNAQITWNDAGTGNVIRNAVEGTLSPERWQNTDVNLPLLNLAKVANGSTFAHMIELYKKSSAPAANEGGGGLTWAMNNSAGSKVENARVRLDMPTVTAGSESSRLLFDTMVAGVLANRMILGAGLVLGAATGGDKGAGTLNLAGDLYKNNTAYTNPDYVFEKAFTGEIVRFAANEGASGYTGPLSLDELEGYIRSTLRLPGISDDPKAIFERADFLLEKVEELTLYIIELHHRLAALEAGVTG